MASFEELEVWRRSSRLCIALYRELSDSRYYGFRDQITRAALSVPSNIAEGYERNSRKEYVQFLRVAKGSCGEVRTQLLIGIEAGLIDKDVAASMAREASEIGRMLGTMISKLSRRP